MVYQTFLHLLMRFIDRMSLYNNAMLLIGDAINCETNMGILCRKMGLRSLDSLPVVGATPRTVN